jgi:hypothetical protein
MVYVPAGSQRQSNSILTGEAAAADHYDAHVARRKIDQALRQGVAAVAQLPPLPSPLPNAAVASLRRQYGGRRVQPSRRQRILRRKLAKLNRRLAVAKRLAQQARRENNQKLEATASRMVMSVAMQAKALTIAARRHHAMIAARRRRAALQRIAMMRARSGAAAFANPSNDIIDDTELYLQASSRRWSSSPAAASTQFGYGPGWRSARMKTPIGWVPTHEVAPVIVSSVAGLPNITQPLAVAAAAQANSTAATTPAVAAAPAVIQQAAVTQTTVPAGLAGYTQVVQVQDAEIVGEPGFITATPRRRRVIVRHPNGQVLEMEAVPMWSRKRQYVSRSRRWLRRAQQQRDAVSSAMGVEASPLSSRSPVEGTDMPYPVPSRQARGSWYTPVPFDQLSGRDQQTIFRVARRVHASMNRERRRRRFRSGHMTVEVHTPVQLVPAQPHQQSSFNSVQDLAGQIVTMESDLNRARSGMPIAPQAHTQVVGAPVNQIVVASTTAQQATPYVDAQIVPTSPVSTGNVAQRFQQDHSSASTADSNMKQERGAAPLRSAHTHRFRGVAAKAAAAAARHAEQISAEAFQEETAEDTAAEYADETSQAHEQLERIEDNLYDRHFLEKADTLTGVELGDLSSAEEAAGAEAGAAEAIEQSVRENVAESISNSLSDAVANADAE